MPQMNIANAMNTTYSSSIPEVVISPYITSGSHNLAGRWQDSHWYRKLGQFYEDPDYQATVINKVTWTIGAGWESDARTSRQLDIITGYGKDSFDTILENQEITAEIGGNSYAQIITMDDKNILEGGKLTNLKPLDPARVVILFGEDGILEGYEYDTGIGKKPKIFEPWEIFHLTTFKVADEVGGFDKNNAVKRYINANKEVFDQLRLAIRHLIKPMIIWRIKTDDTTKVMGFINLLVEARKKGEDPVVPDDQNIIAFDVVDMPTGGVQNGINFREHTIDGFFRGSGLPQLTLGAGRETEADSKVKMLAHEQPIRKRQRYLEQQLRNQLLISITFNQPNSIGMINQNLVTDSRKDAGQGLEFQRGDITAGVAK